jgi:hypothetical protein
LDKKEEWLSSREVINSTKIKSCDLMHYRIEDKLDFENRGNAYFYSKESLDKIKT